MKLKAVVSAILAISMASSGFAIAKDKDRGDRDDRGQNDREYNGPGRGPDGRGPPGQLKKQGRYDEPREGRGYGPNHAYYRGDRLPMEYRHYTYVVHDWRTHQLSAPPPGQQWVQYGGDYVLVAIASGIIVSLILNR